jgi:Tfp pilus assembly PilM family ATPase
MRLLPTSHRTLIGLDIGTHCIKAVQARIRGAKIVGLKTAVMDLSAEKPFDAEHAEELQRLLHRRGFTGNTVAVGAGAQLLRLEAMELPPANGDAALRQLATVEIGRISRLKPGTFENGMWGLPAPARGGTTSHVMAVALPHAAAESLIEPLAAGGFDVAAICPGPSCLAALAGKLVAGDAALHAIIDIGWSATRLLIVHGSHVVFHRAVHDSGIDILRSQILQSFSCSNDVADHLLRDVGHSAQSPHLPPAAQQQLHRLLDRTISSIAEELQLTQNYINHRYPQFTLNSLVLCGGGADIPGFADALSKITSMPTVTLTPACIAAPGAGDASSSASLLLTAAFAVALYAAEREGSR